MNTHAALLDEAKLFVREHLTQICKEFADWEKTGSLCDGQFRTASRKLGYVTGLTGSKSHVNGRLNIVKDMMYECLIHDHLSRAGFFGENI